MSNGSALDAVDGLWKAVYARDWDAVASMVADDAIYFDVPTGPSTAARGPKAIVGRLRLGLDPLVRYEHVAGRTVGNDDDVVMVEHAEIWGWASGESVTLPFVSVHRVTDGRVAVWKDYWDYNTLLSAAPKAWIERIMGAELWWLHDATDDPRL